MAIVELDSRNAAMKSSEGSSRSDYPSTYESLSLLLSVYGLIWQI